MKSMQTGARDEQRTGSCARSSRERHGAGISTGVGTDVGTGVAPIFNPAGNAPRARDLLQLCNQRVAAAKGMVIAAPRDHAPGIGGGDALMGGDGAVAPDAAAPTDVNPPPPPPASERTDALDELTAAFACSSTNPHVVVLADSAHSEAFGMATQRAASGMDVTTIRFSDTPYDETVPIYLAALAEKPVEVEELILFPPFKELSRIAALPSARRKDLDQIHSDIHDLDLATGHRPFRRHCPRPPAFGHTRRRRARARHTHRFGVRVDVS